MISCREIVMDTTRDKQPHMTITQARAAGRPGYPYMHTPTKVEKYMAWVLCRVSTRKDLNTHTHVVYACRTRISVCVTNYYHMPHSSRHVCMDWTWLPNMKENLACLCPPFPTTRTCESMMLRMNNKLASRAKGITYLIHPPNLWLALQQFFSLCKVRSTSFPQKPGLKKISTGVNTYMKHRQRHTGSSIAQQTKCRRTSKIWGF